MMEVNFEHRMFIVKKSIMLFEQMRACSDAFLCKPSGVIFHKLDFNFSRPARLKSLQKLRLLCRRGLARILQELLYW
jgi:hypothetical protein